MVLKNLCIYKEYLVFRQIDFHSMYWKVIKLTNYFKKNVIFIFSKKISKFLQNKIKKKDKIKKKYILKNIFLTFS